jgi:phenylalanyl-tRNA synthetase beta subunit
VENARLNRRHGLSGVRLFEVATVFFPAPGPGELPAQPEHLGIVCGGRVGTPWDREVEFDLFDLKGAVERVVGGLGVTVDTRPAQLVGLLEGSSAELLDARQRVVGWCGQVAGEEAGLPLFAAELSLTALTAPGVAAPPLVTIPSRFPGVAADFTLTHALTVPWAEISAAIAEIAPPELTGFHLKVRYAGPGVPPGAVNTTITFLYNVRDRSLTQEEVNARQLGLNRELERRFGWRLDDGH